MRGLTVAAKVAVAFVLAVAIVCGLALMNVYGVAWFSKTTAETRGQTEVREQTVADGDYRIAAYDHFYDLDAEITTAQQTIANTCTELKDASAARAAELNAFLTPQRNRVLALVNDYNADASKAGTVGQFRASDLPYLIDINLGDLSCP